MTQWQRWFARWQAGQTERGQGLMEYALILSLVAIILVIIISVYGQEVKDLYEFAIKSLPFFD